MTTLVSEPLTAHHHFDSLTGEQHPRSSHYQSQQQQQHQHQQSAYQPIPFRAQGSSYPSSNSGSSSHSRRSSASSSSTPHLIQPQFHHKQSSQVRFHPRPRIMSHGDMRSQSPDGSASSSGGQANSKTGRKGDPRMHKAVAARLNDPNLTLFEALRFGGFDYADDNNPNLVDGEKITLAQRKNQLSRRLRIARRHDSNTKFPAPSPSDSQNKFESLVEKQKQSFQMMQQSMELERRASASQYPAGGLKRARSAPQPPGGGNRSLLDDDEDEPDTKPAPQMMAKYHPQFQPFLVPPGIQYSQSAPFAGMNAPAAPGVLFPNQNFAVPNMAPLPTPDATGVAVNSPNAASGAANSNVSGVALRSLNNTAQSVGLSLEQLALALSSTRNLAHIVLGDDDSGSSEHKKKKQELALKLYEHESRPIYARCMLLAGYKSETTADSSKEYLKFAWKAWQKEGRRLRDLLEENDMLVDEAPDFSGEKPAKKLKTTDESAQSDKDPCECQHVHQLKECGHKAILHQPKDGEAHIDFVVGDKVECFESVPAEQRSKWLSQITQISCDKCEHDKDDLLNMPGPKVLDLKDVDLQGNEWNADFDDTLSGFVRLGEAGGMSSNMSATSITEADV